MSTLDNAAVTRILESMRLKALADAADAKQADRRALESRYEGSAFAYEFALYLLGEPGSTQAFNARLDAIKAEYPAEATS